MFLGDHRNNITPKMGVNMSVHLPQREKEREGDRERERESECVCVRKRVCVYMRERASVRV